MLIVDLNHWLAANGDLDPAVGLAPFVAAIVESATASGVATLTTIPCPKLLGARGCGGLVGVDCEASTVKWRCVACDVDGEVTGWERSRWDLRDIEFHGEPTDVVVFVPFVELALLRQLPLSRDTRAVLAAPPVAGPSLAAVPLTEREAGGLKDALESRVLSTRGVQRNRLERALGRLEQAVAFTVATSLASTRPRPKKSTTH